MVARSAFIKGADEDGRDNGKMAVVDSLTGFLIGMSEVHEHIHKGRFYTVDLIDEALANDASLELLVAPVTGTPPHMRATGDVGGDFKLEVFENTTVSAAGAADTPVNRNRMSSNTASTVITSGPTITDDGTLILEHLIPGGSGGNSQGGGASLFEEMILNHTRVYLIRLTNLAGQAKVAHLQLNFYEL